MTPRPLASSLLALLCALCAPAARAAPDDEPLPYSDEVQQPPVDGRGLRALPDQSEDLDRRHDSGLEEEIESLARYDDPARGLGAEAILGLFLVEAARGSLVDPRLGAGVRGTWDFGRLLADPFLHDGLFLDLQWAFAGAREGTQSIYAETTHHYLTLAPALQVTFGEGRAFGFYAQLGAGLAISSTLLHHEGSQTRLTGLKPLLQYGVGFRGRPLLSADRLARIEFRFEVTRFRRAYMDDTLLAASAGLAF